MRQGCVYTHFFIRITISEGLRFHARLITNRRKKKEKDLPKLALVSRIGGEGLFSNVSFVVVVGWWGWGTRTFSKPENKEEG